MPFIERPACDACGERGKLTRLLSIPYTSDILNATLSERYKGKITTEDFNQVSYEVLRCDLCGFLFQKYIPDDELSNRLYSYESSRIERSLSKKRDATIDYFIRYAIVAEKGLLLANKRPHDTKVLDFGSGWGYFLRMAEAHGAQAEGVEISEERSAFCRKVGLTIHSSIEQTETNHDFIYSDQTFEHIPSPLTYLKKLADRLSPRGILYIAVPDCRDTEQKLKQADIKIIADLYPLEHINGFRNRSLRALAYRAGLEMIPPTAMFEKLIRKAHLSRDGQFAQEALKAFYTQSRSTSLWLRKI